MNQWLFDFRILNPIKPLQSIASEIAINDQTTEPIASHLPTQQLATKKWNKSLQFLHRDLKDDKQQDIQQQKTKANGRPLHHQ